MTNNAEVRTEPAAVPSSDDSEFLEAVEHHRQCLQHFDENDPRSVAAAYRCIGLMPAQMLHALLGILDLAALN